MSSRNDAAYRKAVRLAREWVELHPEFREMPATISEFLGADYLNIDKYVRRRVRRELIKIFGKTVNPDRVANYTKVVFTGCIGWGKDFSGAIILLYIIHWVLCHHDPQETLGLAPRSMIAVMMMSVTRPHAEDIIFGEIKARLDGSPWFTEFFPANSEKDTKRLTKRLAWAKQRVYIIPGDSRETTFEGYNIIGGILDEGDSHKRTRTKCYADIGWQTILKRIKSRFGDKGLALAIGQMKEPHGFMEQVYSEANADDDSYTVRLAIWEAIDPEKYSGKFFYFDPNRLIIMPERKPGSMKIPIEYEKDFRTHPLQSLKDLAGRPIRGGKPFITDVTTIERMFLRYSASHPAMALPVDENGMISPDFRATDSLPRAVHVDLGVTKDACGIAMAHIPRIVDEDGEKRFYIAFDFLMRLVAPAGGQIDLAGVRRVIYMLQDRGFKVAIVTYDGFQSTESLQQLRKRGIFSKVLSIDKELQPYQDLYDSLVEDRVEAPALLIKNGTNLETSNLENIVDTELRGLQYIESNGLVMKVDHLANGGSKDVTDPMAGCVHSLQNTPALQRLRSRFDVILGARSILSQAMERFEPRHD